MAANFTTLRAKIVEVQDGLKKLNTRLSELGATSVSPGSTADDTGACVQRIHIIGETIKAMSKEVQDVRACVVS